MVCLAVTGLARIPAKRVVYPFLTILAQEPASWTATRSSAASGIDVTWNGYVNEAHRLVDFVFKSIFILKIAINLDDFSEVMQSRQVFLCEGKGVEGQIGSVHKTLPVLLIWPQLGFTRLFNSATSYGFVSRQLFSHHRSNGIEMSRFNLPHVPKIDADPSVVKKIYVVPDFARCWGFVGNSCGKGAHNFLSLSFRLFLDFDIGVVGLAPLNDGHSRIDKYEDRSESFYPKLGVLASFLLLICGCLLWTGDNFDSNGHLSESQMVLGAILVMAGTAGILLFGSA